MRMKAPQRVLAIVGGAFLLGTVQAMVFGPVTLGPANLTGGTDAPVGDPDRIPVEPPPPIDGDNAAVDLDPDSARQAMMDDLQNTISTPTATFSPAPDALLDAPVPEGSLTLREAKKLWDEGVYFIDARHEHEFEAGHIQYAAFLESQLFDTDIARANAVMDSIPLDGTIVLYCVGGECDASKNTAAMLEQFGYTDLRIMGAGYEHWVAAGFEISTGSDGGTP